MVFASSPTLVTPALGTPSALVATNATGTAAGLTAGNVTTNANLTGPVTSVGNATAIADSALSIAKTSGLQTALDAKAPLASPTFTGTVTIPTPFTLGAVSVLPTGTELNYVDGVTSNIQTQLDAKQALDADLTTIAGLTATTDNFIQSKSSAWASRTPTQVTADLNVMTGGGSTGLKGLVPSQVAGDTSKFLRGDATWQAIAGGGDALVANPLSQFAATTSAQLAGVLSDETGSGAAVFATTPTLVTPILGTPTSGTLTNCTGLPLAGVVDSTTEALGVGSLELGHASDTTITRVSAGVVAIEGVNIETTATTANTKIGTLTFIIDGGGSAITTGIKGDLEIPFACTINRATLLADQSGSIVVDIWKDTYANFAPTVADTITAAAKPTLSAATKSQDSTLTGWTTSIAAGDILRFNVDSASTLTRVTLSLKVTKT